MDIKIKAREFVDTYENIFHNDWDYSSEMLGESTFEKGETFIKCGWITNWCNKDALDASFDGIKKVLENSTTSDTKVRSFLETFIINIEEVFDTDWEYTKINLNIETSIISADATFLHPNISADELEIENWGYREKFLKQYQDIKSILT